jgi:hypothetical protein
MEIKMSTIRHGVIVSSTDKRYTDTLLTGTDALAEVDLFNNGKKTLAIGQSFTLVPTKLFVCSINGVKILIRLTVDGNTVVLPVSSNLSLPFDSGSNVSITIENPSDNDVTLDAVVSYLTV